MLHRFGGFEFGGDTGELRQNGRAVSQDPGPKTQDPGPRTQDPGPKTQDPGRAPAATTFNNWVTIPLTLAMLAAAIGMMYETFSPPPPERVVVAVSVFDNETGIAEHDRAVAGLSDLVVERLTRLDPNRVAVIGNAAVLRQPRNIDNLKVIARSIRADYVLLGQLQQGETGLRFITHFIRLRDQAHLETARLPISDPNLAGLEAAVVEEFARAVRAHVLLADQ